MTLGELIGPEADLPASWLQTPISGLTADSRAVKPGYLFAALPGSRTDGACFIAEALQKGAAAILVPRGASHALNGTPVIEDVDPRRKLALIAARFFAVQPEVTVAVTGTNGKTSVASFVRQLWEQMGYRAASLGTVGVVGPSGTQTLAHTTPDPVELHRILAGLAKSGVTHLALEASSHGLEQRRVDGVRLAAGAFTNISRDHLDYHPSFEAYFNEKLRLFGELLPRGAGAVVDVDTKAGEEVDWPASDTAPLGVFVWKTIADPFAGRISLFRVASGALKSDTTVHNVTKDSPERLGTLALMQGKTQTAIPEIRAGDIGAVDKLKDTHTGDALGDKTGIRRYGSATIPMDEVLCRAAVDLSGRPYVVHDEPALAPYVGPVYPTSMTRHIWESFGQAARLTLHVSVLRAARPGGHPDAHHVVEAQFKAVARALRDAVAIDPRETGVPSTKGTL